MTAVLPHPGLKRCMGSPARLTQLTNLPVEIEDLRVEAAAEGFRFVDKLVAEWRSGTNRFARPGEVLLGAFQSDRLIAIGGLNHDTYTTQSGVGRLRHVYVRKSARRSGAGAALVQELLVRAEGAFHSVRLRTETREGASFYASLGFRPVQSDAATHVWPARPRDSTDVIPNPESGGGADMRLTRAGP